MTLLYLVHRLPYPPDRGDRIRSWRLLRYLADRATVDVACLADEPVNGEQRRALDRICRRVAIAPLGRYGRWLYAARSLAGGRSASEGLFYSRKLAVAVSAWARDTRYDRVVAFCSSMRPYLDLPGLADVPAMVDLVDVDSQKWFDYAATAHGLKRRLFHLEGRRVRQLELDLTLRAESLLVVSQPEADLLRAFAPAANVHAIANGVDLDYFAPNLSLPPSLPPSLVFVGALDYRANIDGIVWFCREVWPRVHRAPPGKSPPHRSHHAPRGESPPHAERGTYGGPTLTLVGRNPVTTVRELASLPGVELVGQVPDVRPYVSAATISIAPLRVARGIQNKVLEAAAMRKPIIASGPALEGLGFEHGKHVLRADTPNEWLAAITRLMADAALRERLAAAAHAFVVERHSWSARLAPLADLLAESSRHTPLCRPPCVTLGVPQPAGA